MIDSEKMGVGNYGKIIDFEKEVKFDLINQKKHCSKKRLQNSTKVTHYFHISTKETKT